MSRTLTTLACAVLIIHVHPRDGNVFRKAEMVFLHGGGKKFFIGVIITCSFEVLVLHE